MPIYEFYCETCKKVFEFFKLRSGEKIECPHCKETNEDKFRKCVSKDTGFQFKSGKWFKEGY